MKTYEQVSGLGRGLRMMVLAAVVCGVSASGVNGQGTPAAVPPALGVSNSLVTINIDNGPMVQVLNAFSRQSGQNIVIGSEVTGNVTLRVTDKPWQDALDVILKPYGYDYYMVGDTIIICGKDKLPKGVTLVQGTPGTTITSLSSTSSVKMVENFVVKILTLKYLDTADIEEMIVKVSPSTKVGRVSVKSQSWEEKTGQSDITSTSSENLGRLSRIQEKSELVRSKTVILIDTQDAIDRLMSILAKIDVAPTQVQIEAKFVEVRANLLRDIGVEWGTGENGASAVGVKPIGTSGAGSLYAAGGQQISGAMRPSGFDPQSQTLRGTTPFNSGMSLAFQKLTDLQFEMLLHLLQEDVSYNMLSSPRVLTMNNQDAVIIVGQKYPIIDTTLNDSQNGSPGTSTTTLRRYEDIGIKLKVLPQVCDDNFINLIVHPSVRELLGLVSGKTTLSDGSAVTGTEYPLLATREAETQVLVKSGQTIVIGGMLRDKKMTTQIKVPFLGSIPLIGVLFRRETVNTEKIELLIFLTATVRDTTEELAVKLPEAKSMIKVEKGTAPAKP